MLGSNQDKDIDRTKIYFISLLKIYKGENIYFEWKFFETN